MSAAFSELADHDLIGPFARAAADVFATMLNCPCRPGPIQSIDRGHRKQSVTSVIGLSGALTGALSITMSKAGAIQVLSRMTGMESEYVDDFVLDAVGEMANMVGGTGKKALSQFQLLLGLPQVIVGDDYEVHTPRWARHCWLPLECDLGPCSIDVGFNLASGAREREDFAA